MRFTIIHAETLVPSLDLHVVYRRNDGFGGYDVAYRTGAGSSGSASGMFSDLALFLRRLEDRGHSIKLPLDLVGLVGTLEPESGILFFHPEESEPNQT